MYVVLENCACQCVCVCACVHILSVQHGIGHIFHGLHLHLWAVTGVVHSGSYHERLVDHSVFAPENPRCSLKKIQRNESDLVGFFFFNFLVPAVISLII